MKLTTYTQTDENLFTGEMYMKLTTYTQTDENLFTGEKGYDIK